MSELQTRIKTGVVLVGVVVAATLYSIATAFVLWGVLAVLGIKELRDNSMGGSLSALWVLVTSSSVVGLGFFEQVETGFVANFESYNGLNAVALLLSLIHI